MVLNKRSQLFALLILTLPVLISCGTRYGVAFPSPNNSTPQIDTSIFYVSPAGSDSWSGNLASASGNGDGPFLTVSRGIQALNAYSATSGKAGATLTIREGTYYLPASLTLTSSASGSASRPTLIQNYDGEKVVLSGGMLVTGWQQKAGSMDPTMQQANASLPLSSLSNNFHTLRVTSPIAGTSVWASQSRWPKKPNDFSVPDAQAANYWMFTTAAAVPTPPLAPGLPSPEQINLPISAGDLSTIQGWDLSSAMAEFWSFGYIVYHDAIASLNTGTSILTVNDPPYGDTSAAQGIRFALFNIPDAVTISGEWSLNKANGLIYYKQASVGEIASNSTVVSNLTNLFLLQGTAGTPVQFISFKGLTFSDTAYSANDGYPSNTFDYAIEISHGNHIGFYDNLFEFLGGTAIDIQEASSYVTVQENVFQHVNQSAISVVSSTTSLPTNFVRTSNFVDIIGNYLFDTSRFGKQASIVFNSGSNGLIDSNAVSIAGSVGIQILGIYEDAANYSYSLGNVIQNNDVQNAGYSLADAGGIYVSNNEPLVDGTQILNNRVLHLLGVSSDSGGFHYPAGAVGIYLDNMESGATVRGNIVSGTSVCSLLIHGGVDNYISSNLFANGGRQAIEVQQDLPSVVMTGNVITSNVVAFTGANSSATTNIFSMGLDVDANYEVALNSSNNYFSVPNPSALLANSANPAVFFTDVFGRTANNGFSLWQAKEDLNSLLVANTNDFLNDTGGNIVGQAVGPASAGGWGIDPNVQTGLAHYASTYLPSSSKATCLQNLLGTQIYNFNIGPGQMPDPDSIYQCFLLN